MDNFCCACHEPLTDEDGGLIPINLAIPGELDTQVAALVCNGCAAAFEVTPEVIEAIISARVTRFKHPTKRFTP